MPELSGQSVPTLKSLLLTPAEPSSVPLSVSVPPRLGLTLSPSEALLGRKLRPTGRVSAVESTLSPASALPAFTPLNAAHKATNATAPYVKCHLFRRKSRVPAMARSTPSARRGSATFTVSPSPPERARRPRKARGRPSALTYRI